MNILIGILLIAGGAAYAFYMMKKHGGAAVEMQYMRTSTIADAQELIKDMTDSDPDYHHYVELKGMLNCEEEIVAPFTERPAAYYESKSYLVSEETKMDRDANGNMRSRIVKTESQISNEKSSAAVYVKDQSCDTPVYIDVESFGGDVDLQKGCDRFERKDSDWMRRNQSYYSRWNRSCNAQVIGYHLKENLLNINQPIYVLGEMYLNGGKYYIGKSVVGKKASKLSYKSEDQLVNDTKNQKLMSAAIGGAAVLVGIFMIISFFR